MRMQKLLFKYGARNMRIHISFRKINLELETSLPFVKNNKKEGLL